MFARFGVCFSGMAMRTETSVETKVRVSGEAAKPYEAPELVELDVSLTQIGNPGVGADGPFETSS